jgi:hypothetical protein
MSCPSPRCFPTSRLPRRKRRWFSLFQDFNPSGLKRGLPRTTADTPSYGANLPGWQPYDRQFIAVLEPQIGPDPCDSCLRSMQKVSCCHIPATRQWSFNVWQKKGAMYRPAPMPCVHRGIHHLFLQRILHPRKTTSRPSDRRRPSCPPGRCPTPTDSPGQKPKNDEPYSQFNCC